MQTLDRQSSQWQLNSIHHAYKNTVYVCVCVYIYIYIYIYIPLSLSLFFHVCVAFGPKTVHQPISR